MDAHSTRFAVEKRLAGMTPSLAGRPQNTYTYLMLTELLKLWFSPSVLRE